MELMRGRQLKEADPPPQNQNTLRLRTLRGHFHVVRELMRVADFDHKPLVTRMSCIGMGRLLGRVGLL